VLTRDSRRKVLVRYLSGFLVPLAFAAILMCGSIGIVRSYVRDKNAKIGVNFARAISSAIEDILRETDTIILSYTTDLNFFSRIAAISEKGRVDYDDLQILRACQEAVDISTKIRPYIDSIYCLPDATTKNPTLLVSMDGICSLELHPDRDFLLAARAAGGTKELALRRKGGEGRKPPGNLVLTKAALAASVDRSRVYGLFAINLDVKYITARLDTVIDEGTGFVYAAIAPDGTPAFAGSRIAKASAEEREAALKATTAGRGFRLGRSDYVPIASIGGPGAFVVRLFASRASLYETGGPLVAGNIIVIVLSLGAGIAIIVFLTRKRYSDIALFADYLEALDSDGTMTPMPKPEDAIEGEEARGRAQSFGLDYFRLHLSQRELNERKLELETLRDQLNPHFLLNTLQMLNWKIIREMKGYTELNIIVENLSKILSYSLYPAESLAPLDDEISYTVAYATLLGRSRPSAVELRWDIADEDRALLVPRLSLQPIVENAYKHAFPLDRVAMPGGEPEILIRAARRQGDLTVSVRDNGIGMRDEALRGLRASLAGDAVGASGIGLANTAKRIRLLFGRRFGVRVESEEGLGTEVILSFPALFLKRP